MESINTRIKKVIKQSGDSKNEIISKTGMSSTTIYGMQQEDYPITNRNIKIICSVYNINEDWLRNGTGEMINYDQKYDDEMRATFSKLSPNLQKLWLEIGQTLINHKSDKE